MFLVMTTSHVTSTKNHVEKNIKILKYVLPIAELTIIAIAISFIITRLSANDYITISKIE